VADANGNRAQVGPEEAATQLMAAVTLDLEGRGYPPMVVEAAVARARGMAYYKTKPLSESIKAQGFYDVLVVELYKAEDWLKRELNIAESQE